MVDPYFEKLTPQYKIRKTLEGWWPTIYHIINTITSSIFNALIAMIRSAINSLKGGY